MYQILVALKGALSLFDDNECNLIVSIIMALCNIVGGLPKGSRYLQSMFWLAISLIQIGHVPIFSVSLSLLQVVLKTFDSHGLFDSESVSTVLLRARAPMLDVLVQLDAAVGIHFRTDFPFAISVNLLKGLRNPITKTATKSVLNLLLEISAKQAHNFPGGRSKIGLDRLGYILPLLPSADKLKSLFWLAGISDPDVNYHVLDNPTSTGLANRHKHILDRLVIPDSATATLAISVIATMLEHAEYEAEILFIYGFLAEAAQAVPDVFSIL